MPILRSMTGFARIARAFEATSVIVAVKSVNHRGLDLHFQLPAEVEPFEPALRNLIRRYAVRGHIDVRVNWQDAGAARPPALNRGLAAAYVRALGDLAAEHGVEARLDVTRMLAVPGMFGDTAPAEPNPQLEGLVLGAAEEALAALNLFREREGAELGAEIRRHNQTISRVARDIEALRGQAVPAMKTAIENRIRELLNGPGVDPARLAQEVALLADRSDVAEEIARLKIHTRELETLLDRGGETGKKIDFLVQELGRETNTVVSKSGNAGEFGLEITRLGLEAKAAIEKIREQALNLE